jgi:hypothetical protein
VPGNVFVPHALDDRIGVDAVVADRRERGFWNQRAQLNAASSRSSSSIVWRTRRSIRRPPVRVTWGLGRNG